MNSDIKIFTEQIYKLWVLKKDVWVGNRKFGVPLFNRRTFVQHSIFYKEALLLMILINKSHNDTRYEPLLHAYKEVILPYQQAPYGTQKLLALKSAMQDLQQLFMEPNKSITWALAWMRRNGIRSYNPIDLQLFASSWVSMLKHMGDTVLEFGADFLETDTGHKSDSDDRAGERSAISR